MGVVAARSDLNKEKLMVKKNWRNKMACRICGRGSCTESFHSIEEQEQYEEDENGKLVLKEGKKDYDDGYDTYGGGPAPEL